MFRYRQKQTFFFGFCFKKLYFFFCRRKVPHFHRTPNKSVLLFFFTAGKSQRFFLNQINIIIQYLFFFSTISANKQYFYFYFEIVLSSFNHQSIRIIFSITKIEFEVIFSRTKRMENNHLLIQSDFYCDKT